MHLHVCAGMQGYVVGGYQFEFIPIVLSHVCKQRTHYHQLVTTVLWDNYRPVNRNFLTRLSPLPNYESLCNWYQSFRLVNRLMGNPFRQNMTQRFTHFYEALKDKIWSIWVITAVFCQTNKIKWVKTLRRYPIAPRNSLFCLKLLSTILFSARCYILKLAGRDWIKSSLANCQCLHIASIIHLNTVWIMILYWCTIFINAFLFYAYLSWAEFYQQLLFIFFE